MNILKSLSTLLITLLCFNIVWAVDHSASKGDKVDGYVILSDGKKVEGKIIIGSITDNEISIAFIPVGRSKKIIHTPKTLIAYAYKEVDFDDMGRKVKNWVYYERQKADIPPKPFESTSVFMQKEVDGEIELYSYYVEIQNDENHPYQYFYYIKTDDNLVEKVSKDSFERATKFIFKDYTALYSLVESGELSYRNLDQVIRDYNFWLVNKHDRNEYRVAMKGEQEEKKSTEVRENDY